MKKQNLSLVEKKTIRSIFLMLFVQLLIILAFVFMKGGNQPIDMNDTKQIDITVEDICIFRVPGEDWLSVFSDSTEYTFMSRATLKEYSVNKLYESISKGDQITLYYYESNSIPFGKSNVVVEARTEFETYRSLEEFNRGKQGVPIAVIVIFSIIESVFIGVVFVFFWLNNDVIKCGFSKLIKARK